MLLTCLDCALDRRVTGGSQHGHNVSASRERHVGFKETGVRGLEISEDLLIRVRSLDRADYRQALTLDQRCAEFDDVDIRRHLVRERKSVCRSQQIDSYLKLGHELSCGVD